MKRGNNELKYYFRWPLILGGLLAVLAIVMLFVDTNAGVLILIAAAVYGLTALIVYLVLRKKIEKDLIRFGESFTQAEQEILDNIDLPFVIMNQSGDLLRASTAFREQFLGRVAVQGQDHLRAGEHRVVLVGLLQV